MRKNTRVIKYNPEVLHLDRGKITIATAGDGYVHR